MVIYLLTHFLNRFFNIVCFGITWPKWVDMPLNPSINHQSFKTILVATFTHSKILDWTVLRMSTSGGDSLRSLKAPMEGTLSEV